jgi:hypothetical protein
MNNRLKILPLILLLSAVVFSCSKDEDDPGPQNQTPTDLAMNIGGSNWQATKNFSASISFLSDDGTTDGASIVGADDNNQSIQITTGREVDGPGTYLIPSAAGGGVSLNYNGKVYIVKTMTVVIDEIQISGSSKLIKGTFEGTVVNIHDRAEELVITDGVFDGTGS